MDSETITETQSRISDEAVNSNSIKISPVGSLLYSFKLSVGKVAFAGVDLYTNEAIASFHPSPKTDLRFFYYALPDYLWRYSEENIYGAKLLNQERIKNARLAMPPPAEQRRIAGYLDEATGQVDRLVALRRRQMELLRERRAALIQKAVTRGLNANASFKDSGLPWLGQIPKHWEVKRLKHIARFVQTGGTPPSANLDYYDDNGMDWYGPGDFAGALQLGASTRRISEAAIRDGYADAYEPPVILIVGIGASVGKTGLSLQRCFTNQQVNAIGLRAENSAVFFANFLAAYSNIIAANANHSTLPIFNQTQTRSFPVAVPPSPEQVKIVEFIQQEETRVDRLLSAYTRQLELLTEYRAALIHEYVTGQRAVPN